MREPSPYIIQRDPMSCETLCTAQVLYMHDMLELSEVEGLDNLIGRKPGETDLKAGNLRLLFEAGFHVLEVCDVDPRRMVADIDYVCQIWAEDGFSRDQIVKASQRVYPLLRERTTHKLALIEYYSSQYTLVPRKATPADLHSMVTNRWHVSCELVQRAGLAHNVLVVQAKDEMYQVFDPMFGIRLIDKTDLACAVYPLFVGISLP